MERVGDIQISDFGGGFLCTVLNGVVVAGFSAQSGGNGVEGVALAGDNDAGRAIEGSDRDFDPPSLRSLGGDGTLYGRFVGGDGNHGTLMG